MRKLPWKKILLRAFWLLAGMGVIVLLGAAMQKKREKNCNDLTVEIKGENKHLFIDEKDITDILNNYYPVKSKKIANINLRAMENLVKKNPWVQNAEMFIDNNQVVQVKITERQPVARVFTLQGLSFYLDSNAVRLPLSDKISAKVPVFTGFPSDKPLLAKPDSTLLEGILAISKYIQKDSFWMAQLAQIDITPQAGFEMIPTVGDQIIVFGGADDIAAKFNRLFIFYQKAWLQNGMNTYEKIDVQYKNQIVAVKRGTAKAWGDSLNAMRIMNGAIPTNELIFNDSAGTAKMKNAIRNRLLADSTTKLVEIKPNKKTNSKQSINNNPTIKPLTKGNNHHLKNQQLKNQSNQGKNKQPKALMDPKKQIPGENEKVKQ